MIGRNNMLNPKIFNVNSLDDLISEFSIFVYSIQSLVKLSNQVTKPNVCQEVFFGYKNPYECV